MEDHLFWDSEIAALLNEDKAFLETYKSFVSAPLKTNHLDEKTREIIQIALSSSPTHLNERATRHHIKKALHLGVTKKEIAEVLKVVSILGVHSSALAVPILMKHTEKEVGFLTRRQQDLKKKFVDTMGYWNEFRDDLLQLDEVYFEHYYNFLTLPIRRGILSVKTIELIYIAIDASTTHLFERGTDIHIKSALKQGVTKGEIFEVLQITSALGFHTLGSMLPILEQEAARVEERVME